MLCKENYKIVIIIRFLLYQIIIHKILIIDTLLNTEHSLES
jgi:hypothetical protein